MRQQHGAGSLRLLALLLCVTLLLAALVPPAEAKNRNKSKVDRMVRQKRTDCEK